MKAGAEDVGEQCEVATRPRLFLITGERGSGKSTVCARVAMLLRQRGVVVGGVLTERQTLAEGREAAPEAPREAVDLATGFRRRFGRQEHRTGAALPTGPGSDPLTPGWRYDDEVFRWGNEAFERARGCDVLIVDELGPVEILGGRGWTRPLELLMVGEFKTALVVCRPGLLTELARLLRREADAVYEVTGDSRGSLPAVIVARVLA